MSMFALRAGLAVALSALAAGSALAQPTSGPPVHPPRVEAVICPAQIQVVMKPTVSPVPGGWSYNPQVFPATLDPLNLPRIGMGTMSCYYQALKQPAAFVVYQSVGARHCIVRPDHKGFDCT